MKKPLFDVPEVDSDVLTAAQAHLDAQARPPGSLGGLERLAVALCGAQNQVPARVDHPRVVVFAGDHGVARARQVSPYPAEVTPAMVATFLSGKATVCALARAAGADLEVVDVGVVGLPAEMPAAAGISFVHAPAGQGTADLVAGPAMTNDQLAHALRVGADAADRASEDGVDLLALGEMGIGNTTAAAAVAARLLGLGGSMLAGPGTGLDAAGVARKAALVDEALARGGPPDGLAVLADLGGFELAALAGCMLRAGELRIPVLLDGFIVGAAALAAVRECGALRGYLLPATRSAEPGHGLVLDALGVGDAVFALGLRLGEASGAALAIPAARGAARVMQEVATLAEVMGG